MNLLTAVVIECSFEASRTDKEVEQKLKSELLKKYLPHLVNLFRQLDKDGSGEISFEEIRDAPPHVRTEMSKLLGDDQLEEIFRILDFDGSGEIGIDEFFANISKIVTGDLMIADMRTQHQISSAANGINERINEVNERLDGLENVIQELVAKLAGPSGPR